MILRCVRASLSFAFAVSIAGVSAAPISAHAIEPLSAFAAAGGGAGSTGIGSTGAGSPEAAIADVGIAETAGDVQTESPLAAAIRAALEGQTATPVEATDLDDIKAFYSARGDLPVWLDTSGLTRAGRDLVREIQSAGDWGLNDADFVFHSAHLPPPVGGWTSEQAARAELELTRLVVRYALQARGGRIASPSTQLSTYLDRRPNVPKAGDVLVAVSTAGAPVAALRAFQPQHDQFVKLKAYLAQMRSDMARQQDARLEARGPELRRGDRHGDVLALRRRLSQPTPVGLEDVYDDNLFAAVKAYQASKSLRADGVVGRATRRSLNGSDVTDRSQAVIANMEQWRWMPAELGQTHAFVNVPSYSVDFVSNGRSLFRDRVVVGTQETQTPIFSHNMETIVMRPEWNLPDSIKIRKVVAAGGDGRTLESHGYKIRGSSGRILNSTRINWSRADLSKYTIFQPSGSDNALGLVKFLFPNKHSVYLHDTPSKSLFNEQPRLFSHGCVRVRNPLVFAQHLLDYDKGPGTMNAVQLSKRGPLDNQIELTRAIPVHIGYFTVWMEDSGAATFFSDPYGHEKRVNLALANQWAKIKKGKDHLAAVDMSELKSMISNKRRQQASRKARNGRAIVFAGPEGLTKAYPTIKYRPYGNTVGDMIRRAMAN